MMPLISLLRGSARAQQCVRACRALAHTPGVRHPQLPDQSQVGLPLGAEGNDDEKRQGAVQADLGHGTWPGGNASLPVAVTPWKRFPVLPVWPVAAECHDGERRGASSMTTSFTTTCQGSNQKSMSSVQMVHADASPLVVVACLTAWVVMTVRDNMRDSLSLGDEPCSIVCIGNPGAGKSTFLNCISGLPKERHFPSGYSTGSGMTVSLDIRKPQGKQIHTFIDTPGLSDIKNRRTAAAEITKALRQGGKFKVIFMMTLESGRVRPADEAVIKLVLESAPEITHCGIIVNKLGRERVRMYMKEPSLKEALRELLLVGVPQDRHDGVRVHFMQDNDTLKDKDNVVITLGSADFEFVRTLPACHVTPEKVDTVPMHEYQHMIESLEGKLKKMNDEMNAKIAEIGVLEAWLGFITTYLTYFNSVHSSEKDNKGRPPPPQLPGNLGMPLKVPGSSVGAREGANEQHWKECESNG